MHSLTERTERKNSASWIDRHAVRVAIGATIATVIILMCTVACLIFSRYDAIEKTRATSANIAQAVARDIGRNLETYDLSLQAVVDGMSDPEVFNLPEEMRRRILFDRSTGAEYVSAVYAVNEHGNIVEAWSRRIPTVNLADREYFKVHRDRDDLGLYISRPYVSNSRDGAPAIALSRRISKADGSFGGIALVAINLAYFQQLVDDIKLGEGGASTILQTDGLVVARNPRLTTDGAVSIRNWPVFAKALSVISGSLVARSPLDGVERIMTFAHVPGTNLMVLISPSLNDATADWAHHSLITGLFVVFVSSAFTVVVWLLVYAVRQRDAAQARLIELADTDALTGVANRRKLDFALEGLWHDAARDSYEVALLFIDADRFKVYNDVHGHEVGDRALRFIAECLAMHARRMGDLVARYGGEEFVVALPGCSLARAQSVAEAIRRDVAGSGSAHALELPGVTVSIGVVTCHPAAGIALREALRSADEALYRSKTAGRNQVTASLVLVDCES